MGIECIRDMELEDTGFNYTMSFIQGKFKMCILYALAVFGIVSFYRMKRFIGGTSYKSLSAALK